MSNLINMDTTTIILTILGSGAFSAIVTGILNNINSQRVKSIDFKYDYKKYMLEKRKAAYDEVEKLFLTESLIFQNSIASDIVTTHDLKQRLEILEEMSDKISGSLSFWLSGELIDVVALYYKFVSLLINGIKKSLTEETNDPNYEISEIARVAIVGLEKKLRSTYYYDIVNAYMHDLTQLDNIDAFIRHVKEKIANNKSTNQ